MVLLGVLEVLPKFVVGACGAVVCITGVGVAVAAGGGVDAVVVAAGATVLAAVGAVGLDGLFAIAAFNAIDNAFCSKFDNPALLPSCDN